MIFGHQSHDVILEFFHFLMKCYNLEHKAVQGDISFDFYREYERMLGDFIIPIAVTHFHFVSLSFPVSAIPKM